MNRSSWIILWVAFSAGVIAASVQLSIPPLLPVLIEQLSISYGNSGLLMSLFALATLLSAVPTGFIIQKYGVHKIGILALVIMILGTFCAMISPSFGYLIISRIIQGIGFGIISVTASTVIGAFVDKKMMSIAMGIWSTWIPVGSLLMFLFAPIIVTKTGLNVFWPILIVFIVVILIIYSKIIPTKHQENNEQKEDVLPNNHLIKQELKNPNVWWIAIAFASFTFSLFTFHTWIPTYLTDTTSMSVVTASWIPSIVSIFMIISNLYAGVLLNRFENHLLIFLIPPLITLVLWPMFLIDNIPLLYVFAILLGLLGGFVPTIIFAAAPLMAKSKETIGIVTSVVIIGENAGILIGPGVFGMIREFTEVYTFGFWTLFISGIITLIATLKIYQSKVFEQQY